MNDLPTWTEAQANAARFAREAETARANPNANISLQLIGLAQVWATLALSEATKNPPAGNAYSLRASGVSSQES